MRTRDSSFKRTEQILVRIRNWVIAGDEFTLRVVDKQFCLHIENEWKDSGSMLKCKVHRTVEGQFNIVEFLWRKLPRCSSHFIEQLVRRFLHQLRSLLANPERPVCLKNGEGQEIGVVLSTRRG